MSTNFVRLVFDDQVITPRQAIRFTPAWAQRLTNIKKLNGHEGCVNRLAWSEDGSLLASGSDDRQVLLWSYPDVERSPLALQTEHAANIFGVQFMPCTNNSQLITGAMDDTVMLHHMDRLSSHLSRRSCNSATPVAFESTLYGCHRARVKGVEVEPNNPHLFWSAAEDGTVRQYDTRLSSNSQKAWDSSNCLLSVKAVGPGAANRSIELKGISLNKAHVHQLAVAAGDVYVRVYDRRMLSTGSPKDDHVRADPVLQMAPPHMCLINSSKRTGRAHTTCVNFGQKGDKLVATYHCDQAYAFDVTSTGVCTTSYGGFDHSSVPDDDSSSNAAAFIDGEQTDASISAQSSSRAASQEVLQKAEELKNLGNHAFFSRDLPKAVAYYSQALHLNPTSPMLHTNRAAALISRDWVGDAMWALKDCEAALSLDSSLAKAHYRRIQALKAMSQIQAAYTAIQAFQERFPSAGEDAVRLKEEVYALLEERAQHAKQRQWRLMQKKRARGEAQARSHQGTAEAEASVLATDTLAEAGSMSSPERATRQRGVPSLSPLNIIRHPSLSGSSPAHPAAEVPCPVPDVGLRRPAMWGATDTDAISGHDRSGSDGDDAAWDEVARQSMIVEPSAEPAQAVDHAQTDTAGARQQIRQAGSGHRRDAVSQLEAPDEAMLQDGATAAAASHDPASSSYDVGNEDDMAEAGAGPVAARQHVSASQSASRSASGEAETEESTRDSTANAAHQDRPDPVRLPSHAVHVSSEGEPDSPGGEAQLPEEGWKCEEIDMRGWHVAGKRQGLLDGADTWTQGVGGRRMLQRYVGHSNVQTDIKEAIFMGRHDDLVAAGSDDGSVFIYDAITGQVVKILQADEDVANCVQCHPTLLVLATSGIEHTIKLWSPEGPVTPVDPVDCAVRIRRNQERIMSGPQVLRSISPRVFQALHDNPQLLSLLQRGLASRQGDADQTDEEDEVPGDINCRVN